MGLRSRNHHFHGESRRYDRPADRTGTQSGWKDHSSAIPGSCPCGSSRYSCGHTYHFIDHSLQTPVMQDITEQVLSQTGVVSPVIFQNWAHDLIVILPQQIITGNRVQQAVKNHISEMYHIRTGQFCLPGRCYRSLISQKQLGYILHCLTYTYVDMHLMCQPSLLSRSDTSRKVTRI